MPRISRPSKVSNTRSQFDGSLQVCLKLSSLSIKYTCLIVLLQLQIDLYTRESIPKSHNRIMSGTSMRDENFQREHRTQIENPLRRINFELAHCNLDRFFCDVVPMGRNVKSKIVVRSMFVAKFAPYKHATNFKKCALVIQTYARLQKKNCRRFAATFLYAFGTHTNTNSVFNIIGTNFGRWHLNRFLVPIR